MESKNINKVEEFDVAMHMASLGYRWQLVCNSGLIDPMYCKQCMSIGSLMRDYPEETFTILPIRLILGE